MEVARRPSSTMRLPWASAGVRVREYWYHVPVLVPVGLPRFRGHVPDQATWLRVSSVASYCAGL